MSQAYTSQILSLTMFGLVMCEDRISLQARRAEIIAGLRDLPEKIKQVLKMDEKVLEIAKELYNKKSLLIMGRGFNFATCLEGALKVKELTYMHSEGIQAGELKHGPLALVDSTVPILMIMMRDNVFTKCMNALQQVQKLQNHTTCSQLNYNCNDCVLKGYRTRGKTDPDCRGRRHRDLQMGRAQPRGDMTCINVPQ